MGSNENSFTSPSVDRMQWSPNMQIFAPTSKTVSPFLIEIPCFAYSESSNNCLYINSASVI